MGKIIKTPNKDEVFGLLTFISDEGKNEKGDRMGCYKCECGNERKVLISRVNNGYVKSCGCYKKTHLGKMSITHGLSKHPLYNIWSLIIDRCENKNAERYSDYGGNGITVCKEWRSDFEHFYNWAISNGWKKGLQIDKDVNGGKIYSPQNCLIITQKENANNCRSNKYITYKGETRTVSQWCETLGIKQTIVYKRLARGWDYAEALEIPNLGNRAYKYYNN